MGKKAFLLLGGIIAVLQIGCKEDPILPPKTALAAVTNLSAYSADSNTVGLQWKASTDSSRSDLASYQVTVKRGTATVTTVTVNKVSSSSVVTGLAPGIYTFEIVATATSSSENYTSSSAASVVWSPAKRISSEGGIDIKVYETTSSTGFPSGLIFLYPPANVGPKTVSISIPGADALLIDLYVRTESNSGVSLRSAHLFNPLWRITRFSSVAYSVASLDDPRPTPPDTTTYASTNTVITIDSTAASTSRVIYFKGNNGNYGRLLLKRSPNGTLIWGTSPEQYLNVTISYQTQAYNPYAKPTLINKRRT